MERTIANRNCDIVTFDNDRQPDTCFLNCRRINVGDSESYKCYKKQNLVLVTLVTVVVLKFQFQECPLDKILALLIYLTSEQTV